MKESVLGFEEKTTQPGLPIFKLPASTKNLLRQTRYILFLTIPVYDY